MTLYGPPLADPLRPWETDVEPHTHQEAVVIRIDYWRILGLALCAASAFLVIAFLAVIVRLAVSR